MAIKRVAAHRRANKPVRSHARKHFKDIATFRGKVKALKDAKPSMSDRMARGIVGKWVKEHEDE